MPPRRLTSVWILTAVVAAAAVALWLHARGVPVTGGRLPWWGLALGFTVTELLVVHVHFRRSAYSLTFGEIPLVLGLLFAAPAEVAPAWVLGVALVLLRDRCPPPRLAFNLAQLALTSGLALLVLRAGGPPDVMDPSTWAWVAAAVLTACVTSALLIAVAMSLAGERVTARRVPRMLGVAAAAALTNSSLGLGVAVVVATAPLAGLLLAAPVVALYVSYRAYESERSKSLGLEFLSEAARALHRADDASAGLAGMLALALDTFRAGTAEVAMFGAGGEDPGSRVVLGPDQRVEVGAVMTAEVAADLHALVDGGLRPRVIRPADAGPALARQLEAARVESAMVAGLPGDGRMVGAILVANRVGLGGGFAEHDLRLFGTLAAHAGAALGQERLEQRVTKLRHQAFHDPLTGLANRLLFEDRVAHALSRREGNVVAIYIDLDDFKPVNDELGHEAGDELLREVGRRLRATLRAADTPARLGGDEFGVLVTDVESVHVHTVARRILESLAEPCRIGEAERAIRASVGIAVAESGSLAADELIRRADAAMYVAKHAGKHGYTLYGETTGRLASAA